MKSKSFQQLEENIKNKMVRVGVVGLGYVGLPLAIAFSEAGLKVLGFDIQQERVESINQGKSYIADVSSKRLATVSTNKLLEATADKSRLNETDAICVCLPTPLSTTKMPDLSYIIHESEEIAKNPKVGQLIILESTTYPGTTKELVLPILQRSGLKAGVDFYLAYSPERVNPGSKNYNIRNTPKVITGVDPESTKLTELLYGHIVDKIVLVSTPEVAEMSKIFENIFRNVNIALVNELAQLCEKMGISVWEVIDAASSKPYGYMPFYPGPGTGGHCIPLDPHYLISRAMEYDFHAKFVKLATDINEQMPYYITSRIMDNLNIKGKSLKNTKVLVLGIAYKKDVADIRESPSLQVIQLLFEKGVEVSYNDPYIPEIQLHQDTLTSVEPTAETLSSMDCVVIATDHSCYDYQHIADKANLVFDTRGATKGLISGNVIRLGE
ncbi:nucleotide sugar dehydrogenase [Chloroflexota bacterium]